MAFADGFLFFDWFGGFGPYTPSLLLQGLDFYTSSFGLLGLRRVRVE